jgi:hypothetical protein
VAEDDGGGAGSLWPADLARLERARTEVFDGPDAMPLRRADLADLSPEEFPALQLRLIPASAVVSMESNADEVWSAVEDDATLPLTAAGPRRLLVWRRDLAVIHRTLAKDEARLVERLPAGISFAGICECLVDRSDAIARALALVLSWLDAEILAGP